MNRVLVIEENYEDLEIVSVILSRFGFETISVLEGEEACSVVQLYNVDMVLWDLGVPSRLSACESSFSQGLRIVRQFNEAFPNIPIIGMTALLREEARQATKGLKLACLLTKPFSAEDLQQATESVRQGRIGTSRLRA